MVPQLVSTRVNDDVLNALQRIADERGVKLAVVVREALVRFVGDRRPRPRRSKTSRS